MALKVKKGTAPTPPEGTVKPSRRDLLLASIAELSDEQTPDTATLRVITQPPALPLIPTLGATPTLPSPSAPHDAPAGAPLAAVVSDRSEPETQPAEAGIAPSASHGDATPRSAEHTLQLDPAAIARSPFQPHGRPSQAAVEAVGAAIRRAGSPAALIGPDGAEAFGALDSEAARLAELAADIALHGITSEIEIRRLADGSAECLSGHRRLAAARLARCTSVPVVDRGAITNAEAASRVLRGNQHRENFRPWHEAVLVALVEARRRADALPATAKDLGRAMGWSHGKANVMLRIRRALSAELLAKAAGADRVADAEDALARLEYKDLVRLEALPEASRLTEIRRLLGIVDATMAAPSSTSRGAIHYRPKRGGGCLLDINQEIESLDLGDATLLLERLEQLLERVRARTAYLRPSR